MDIIIINTDISTISILYLHLYHIKIRSLIQYILFLTYIRYAFMCNLNICIVREDA